MVYTLITTNHINHTFCNMAYIVIDTETTGFPQRQRNTRVLPSYEKTHMYDSARIVSISWVVLAPDFEPVAKHYYVIKPDGFQIPPDSTAIHGITDEHAAANGITITEMLEKLSATFKKYKDLECLVAHNLEFDYGVLMSEIYRASPQDGLIDEINFLYQFCTMKESCQYFPSRKYPKLVELFEFCFPELEMQNAHNALDDTRNCSKCFEYLMRNNKHTGTLHSPKGSKLLSLLS